MEPGTWHLYAYCANNPVNYVDPTGHFVWVLPGLVIGGAVTIVVKVAAVIVIGGITYTIAAKAYEKIKKEKQMYCYITATKQEDGASAKKLFEFLRGCSDFLAIIKTHDEKLTKRQFCKIKKELENDVKKQREAFRTNEDGYADRLNTLLGIKTKKEVKEYFYNMQEGHNDLLEELEITYEDVQEDMELFFEKGMIKKKTTCITPVTIGGPFDILYFPSTALKEEFGKLNSIFDTITVCGIDFDDYIFYKKDLSNENAVVGLCGHEKEGFLELTEQKFQALKALELPYYVSCTSEI